MRDALLSERERLFEQLQQVSWLEPYPSQANFILCKVLEVSKQLDQGHLLAMLVAHALTIQDAALGS